MTCNFLSSITVHLSSFNELKTSYRTSGFRQRILVHNLLTETINEVIAITSILTNKIEHLVTQWNRLFTGELAVKTWR